MAHVVVTGTFPGHVASEIGKKFLELPKLPNFVKTEHVFNTADKKYRFFTIYEITEEDKYFEGIKAIVKRFAGYREVKGYEFTIFPVLEAKDALSIIGLG